MWEKVKVGPSERMAARVKRLGQGYAVGADLGDLG